jgi:hypothetical protein
MMENGEEYIMKQGAGPFYSVCARKRERVCEGERVCVSVCVREREAESMCLCVCVREWVCVREQGRELVCV